MDHELAKNGRRPEGETAPAATPATPKVSHGSTPAFYQRRKKRGNEICQLLIRNGDVQVTHVREALKIQEEKGGQVGQILIKMGACSRSALARALLQQLQLKRTEGVNRSMAARENPMFAGLEVTCSPVRTTLALLLTDTLALSFGAALGEGVNVLIFHTLASNTLLVSAPAIAVCLIAFASQGLYSAMAQSPPDELRNATGAMTLMLLFGSAVALFAHRGSSWSLAAVGVWWASSLALVPLARAFLRAKCARKPWWGHPVVVLGAGKAGRMIVRTLRSQPASGLRPVMVLDDDRSKHGTLRARISHADAIEVRSVTQASNDLVTESLRAATTDLLGPEPMRAPMPSDPEGFPSSRSPGDQAPVALAGVVLAAPGVARPRGSFAEIEGVPVVGDFALAPVLAKRLRISYAMLAMPGASADHLLQLTERVGGTFSHLLVIPDLFGFASLGVPAKDVGGVLGIEVRQQLLLPWPRFAKRVMDVVLTGLGGLLILPIIGLLALAIKIDSRGAIFYFQERLGTDGRRFRAAKFRSMHGDGEERLKAVLENDPKMRAEYEEFHKLTNDPRVTRVGRLVRKYSLDELPQLWNVITGDMSLVGPRPYLEREIPQMENKETIILRATPGLTGLWQVSDRNTTGFGTRLKVDIHYVRNWSPWLDVYILARTFGVVIKGTGV